MYENNHGPAVVDKEVDLSQLNPVQRRIIIALKSMQDLENKKKIEDRYNFTKILLKVRKDETKERKDRRKEDRMKVEGLRRGKRDLFPY